MQVVSSKKKKRIIQISCCSTSSNMFLFCLFINIFRRLFIFVSCKHAQTGRISEQQHKFKCECLECCSSKNTASNATTNLYWKFASEQQRQHFTYTHTICHDLWFRMCGIIILKQIKKLSSATDRNK